MAKKNEVVQESAENSLKSLRDRLSKACKGVHVSIMSESTLADRNEWVETPSYDLNRILSGDLRKGLPKKTWTLFVAPEHAGKSSFMALIAAKAKQKYNSQVIVIDTEGAWDKNFVKRWGLDPDEVLFVFTPWVDDIKVLLANLIDGPDENIILILDSIGGIEKKKIKEDALAGDPKADQGGLQKELKPLYKMIGNFCKTKNSIVLAAGHWFGSPNSYGAAEEIGGGKFLKLATDIIVSFKKSKMFDSSKNVIGSILSATTLKNRLYPPFNEAVIEIDFVNGINPFAGLLEIAKDAGLVTQKGAYYYWTDSNGEVHTYHGASELESELFNESNKDKIIDQLNDYIKQTGFSTVNAELKQEHEQLEKETIEEAIALQ